MVTTENPRPTIFHSMGKYIDLPSAAAPWVVDPILPSGGLLNLYGAPKTGKSFGVIQLAHAISSGEKEWMGYPIRQHGPVM